MNLKAEIRRFAHDIGFDRVGFANAEPFFEENRILKRRKSQGLLSPFEDYHIDRRCCPDQILSGVRTIICVAIGYLTLQSDRELITQKDDCGRLSKYAQVYDYHHLIRRKLNEIVDFISKRQNGKFEVLVDSGSLIERAAAKRAGIGWLGQNTCLFVPELGSWVFLGEILTDVQIDPDEPLETQCDNCGRCIRACPTGALFAPYQINPYKCLSYITQMKGSIPKEYRTILGDRIFGCDTCQEVCPHNTHVRIPNHLEFVVKDGIDTNLYKVAKISKNEYIKSFGKTAAGWRGRNTIRRNAVCALANTSSDAIPFLESMLRDPSETVREHVQWAIRRLK
ncbi:MAG: tRNA epoxyqueuosine(34) reductase QueG [Thermoanaerobacterales bacterium]|nr:tRNA epoxyqueuosine(34) reductase QueG [Thermoanaerobacterales bacterium]